MAAPTPWYNVFVGSETGFLKGVNTEKKYFQNVNRLGDKLDREQEICAMCWRDTNENHLYCGLKNRHIKVYDTRCYTYEDTDLIVKGGDGKLRGILRHNDHFVTGVESGMVKVWNPNGKQQAELNIRHNIHRMRQNPNKPWLVAIGGRENELKIWDLKAFCRKPVFRAENVENDFLNLRIPVWVTDMRFLPDGDKVVMCSGHSHIRVYDPNSSERRPVIQMEFDEYPLTALSLTHREHEVIVANSHGRMGLFDLRRKLLVHCYKSFAGSIRCVETHPTLNLVASCGLDRFLRVHDINTRKLLQKIYLKSRLNCLLFGASERRNNFDEDMNEECEPSMDLSEDVGDSNDNAVEEVWRNMQIVCDDDGGNKDNSCRSLKFVYINKSLKRKRKQKGVKIRKILEKSIKIL